MKKASGESPSRTMAVAMRLGIHLVVATLVGAFLGYLLDKLFETKPWLMIVGLFLGAVAGFRDLYRFVKNELDQE